jgi:small subunit ribosomal protein S21
MLIVKIKEGKGGIERALKELKSKVIKTRQVRELQNRKEFEKPSVKKRNQLRKAAYIQKKYKQKD